MYARVSTYEGASSADYDSSRDKMEAEILPRIRELPGYKGVLSLVDRNTGQSLSITFWEDGDAIAGTREAADRVRAQAAATSGSRIANVTEYEIGLADFTEPPTAAGGPKGSESSG